MGKLLWGMCIALVLTSLAGGWHLGQVQSELIEIRMQLVVAENRITALQSYLAIRGSKLLSMKQELERTQQELDKTQQKLEQAQPRHFNSLEELETWLANDDTDQMQYCRNEFNCIDFALTLQERALADGYILSTEVLPVGAHWVNSAIIGDAVHVIEPQDDRIILEKKINRGESG